MLIGLGLTEFSMTPAAIPAARHLVGSVRADTLRAAVRRALHLGTTSEIEEYLAQASGEAAGPAPRRACIVIRNRSSIVSQTVTRVEKPWGYELHWAKTDRYVGKVIHINAGHALSLQYHNRKDETIFLWAGKLLFEIKEGGGAEEVRGDARPAVSRHARHDSPDDGHRGLRRVRGLDAGAG